MDTHPTTNSNAQLVSIQRWFQILTYLEDSGFTAYSLMSVVLIWPSWSAGPCKLTSLVSSISAYTPAKKNTTIPCEKTNWCSHMYCFWFITTFLPWPFIKKLGKYAQSKMFPFPLKLEKDTNTRCLKGVENVQLLLVMTHNESNFVYFSKNVTLPHRIAYECSRTRVLVNIWITSKCVEGFRWQADADVAVVSHCMLQSNKLRRLQVSARCVLLFVIVDIFSLKEQTSTCIYI